MNQEKNTFKSKPVDLVKDFYDQDIDHKALEKALTQRKNTAKGFTNFSLDPYTGEFGDSQKKHLLNRTLIGYSRRHLKDLEDLSLSDSIDLIFSEEELGEPVNTYYQDLSKEEYFQRYNNEDVDPLEPWISRPIKGTGGGLTETDSKVPERRTALINWLAENIYNQRTSIHWKLFIFLQNLVPVEFASDTGHQSVFKHIQLKFNACFGSYKQFIRDVSIDITMLRYLNLYLSRKETPDENYAREIQELFTVGKRPFSQFSEGDVREIAKALVGWSFDYSVMFNNNGIDDVQSFFDPENHDTSNKNFSSFYNNKTIQGKSGQEGENELDEVVDILFETEESSIYIARRLYQFFVYPVTTDEIENKIITPLANIFRDSNFSLVETLKVLLKSQHFFDSSVYNSMIKSPLEFNFGIVKQIDLANGEVNYWDGQQSFYPDTSPEIFGKFSDSVYVRHRFFDQLTGYYTENQGFSFTMPPSVSGWPPYYQDPIYDLFWLNTNTIQKRKKFIQGYGKYGFSFQLENGGYGRMYANTMNFISNFNSPNNFNLFFEDLIGDYLNLEISPELKESVKNKFLSGASESHWNDEYEKYLNNEPFDEGVFEEMLRDGLLAILELAEFQLF
ncbi:DUF1800 domain-containing protein [Flavobacteriaceae bacterium]|nr:DUF1800 domain-containing protein [Flavobacteriaceae bacterium]